MWDFRFSTTYRGSAYYKKQVDRIIYKQLDWDWDEVAPETNSGEDEEDQTLKRILWKISRRMMYGQFTGGRS
jgi:hypothetical protein